MKKLKQMLCFVVIICTLFTASSCWGGNTKSNETNTKPSLVECPSCHKKVTKLITKEVFAGNGDYKSWCSACWKEFDSLNIYK